MSIHAVSNQQRRSPALIGLTFLLFMVLSPSLRAHEIPNDVTVHVFLKPEGPRLRLLVRVPMSAMRDIQYSRNPEGYFDLEKADVPLRTAAKMWVGDNIELFEEETRLPEPTIVATRAVIQSDRSIASYDEFLAHFARPQMTEDKTFDWNQGLLDIFFEYPIQSANSNFSIRPSFARLGIRTITILRFMPPAKP